MRAILVVGLLLLVGCGGREEKGMNPVSYFEIPVRDMDRAMRFYEVVLGYRLVREQVDGNEMALFPAVEGGAGCGGVCR